MKQFFIKNKYLLLSFAILLFACILRFYLFGERWSLGNDDSREIMIAKQALLRHELPLIGPFSSAGPFVFGPFFYWFIMASYFLFPSVFTIPWVFLGFVGIATVGILMVSAKKIAGNNFVLLVGLFAATCPQLVIRSSLLGPHTFISFLTACMILFLLIFIEKKKIIYAFLMGSAIGTGINFHYQALNLLIFLFVVFFVQKKSFRFKALSFVSAGGGVILGLLPLLIWDSYQQFANFNNLFDYFLIAQYRLYVPNSWRLFLFTFLPNYWGFVVGGSATVGLVAILAVGFTTVVAFVRKKIPYQFLLLLIPSAALLFLNRFYKGERSEGYLLYFLPFILLLTSYTIYLLFQPGRFVLIRRILACVLFVILFTGNLLSVQKIYTYPGTVVSLEKSIDELVSKYPNKKFVVYDYKGSLSTYNQALSALLYRRQLTASDGMPIGFLCYIKCEKHTLIVPYGGLYIADLRKAKDLDNKDPLHPKWVNVNPENMYDDLIGWSKRHELRATFSLQKYLTDKLHF